MDKPDTLSFYFDYISHNAYLAWTQMRELCARHGLMLEPVPVLFAGLLKAHGQRGPAEVLPKSRWMLWNVLRKARQRGIPIAPPFSHPFNPLIPLRVSCVEMPLSDHLLLVDRLFAATWVQGRAVHEADVVEAVLHEAGLHSAALLAQAQSEPVKNTLRDNTEAALAAGVFGVPTMRVRGELFFGYDDLPHLEAFLAGRDPLGDRSAYSAWLEIQPTAQRKGP